MIITISDHDDMWKNQQKMLDNDNQIKLSSLIVILALEVLEESIKSSIFRGQID